MNPTMNADEKNPEVVAWRLSAMESKVDALTEKIDSLREIVTKNVCSQPGACVSLMDGLRRLESLVTKHEQDLQAVRLDIEKAKAGAKALTSGAVAIGSVLGAVASLVVQWVVK
jgi:hypothetical protein